MLFSTTLAFFGLLGTGALALPRSSSREDAGLMPRAAPGCPGIPTVANYDDLDPTAPDLPNLPAIPGIPRLPVLTGLFGQPAPGTANVNIIPTPYQALSYNEGGFRYVRDDVVKDEANGVAFFNPLTTEPLKEPRISAFGPVEYFNLNSGTFFCVQSIEGLDEVELADCTISFEGKKGDGTTVNAQLVYTKGPPVTFTFPAAFKQLKSVLFKLSDTKTVFTYPGIDDLKYDVFKPCQQ